MQIKCISTDGGPLAKEFPTLGFSAETKFHIDKNQIYTAYGLSYWRRALFYLIVDNTELPNWYPSDLFEVTDGRLPNNWQFKSYTSYGSSPMEATLGYPELLDEKHAVGLIEREPVAAAVFYKARVAIDQFHQD